MQKNLVGAILLFAIVLVATVFFGQMQGWFNLQKPDNQTTNQTTTPTPTSSPTQPPVTTNKPSQQPTLAPTPTQTRISTPTPVPTHSPTSKHTSYFTDLNVTWDGKWTDSYEWLDAGPYSTVENLSFRDKVFFVWINSSVTHVWEGILIETDDNTTDSSDYWEICVDTLGDGGNAPQIDDFKMSIIGHAYVTFYRGNGTSWLPSTVPSSDFFKWNNSIGTSPLNNATHWICEVGLEHIGLLMNPVFYMRVAVFDGHDGGLGLQSWPSASSGDVPNDWGYIDYYMGRL